MRVLADIVDRDIAALDALARDRGSSRAALIRAAVSEFLGRHGDAEGRAAFGLWGPDGEDGLAYQARMRAEW
jgi:hypothetical protein